MTEHPRYQVYVLCNAQAKFYIGISTAPESRLAHHNHGQSTWTKRTGPWRIVWISRELSYSDARKFENKLKRQKAGDGFYKITGLSRHCGC
jgi:predicted GIY-YIG superfamily endonuclease